MQRVGSNAFDRRRSSQKALARNVFGGGVALASVALACVWFLLHDDLASVRPIAVARPMVPTATAQATASTAPIAAAQQLTTGSIPATPPAAQMASLAVAWSTAPADPFLGASKVPIDPNDYVVLLDPAHSFGASPVTLAENPAGPPDDRFAAPAPTATPVAQDIPRPAPPVVRRPVQTASLAPVRSLELRAPQSPSPLLDQKAAKNKVLSNTAVLKIFEKALGKPPQDEPIALAYAAPDGGVQTDSRTLTQGLPLYDSATAVYDISAATVYMPDGTKLEAHSGVGPAKDDPRHAHARMRGVTPPHVYDLKLRESLFHGVRALRLNPVGGEAAIFGRSGILAHSYLLGPRGDSHGCVSFKNYDAFLQAFLKGEVKRMVVVARLD